MVSERSAKFPDLKKAEPTFVLKLSKISMSKPPDVKSELLIRRQR